MTPSSKKNDSKLSAGREKALLAEELKGMSMIEMSETIGWKTLQGMANEELLGLQEKIDNSNDTNEVFACTKRKSGILFFLDQARRLISEGREATNTLSIYKPE
jgi:hypothetical protein